MYTFGQLKSDCRARLFAGGEADNLVASHDKDFIDAIVDLQTWVVCLQTDNTDIFPQCSTTYNCGLTVLPCPRGIIKKLSVIDKIDPITGLENPDVDDDYCSEITYVEVDFCHVRRYLDRSRSIGGCCGVGLWFGLPFAGFRPSQRVYPAPTDADVPAGLPVLPLGFHYPQTSTDRTWGRAGYGIWAKERGNIYVAPWIQSTETIIVTWDGIKRTWSDADAVDADPLFSKAVEEYVRWQHAKKWDRDDQAAMDAGAEYNLTRQILIRQCREETRVRNCEPSFARASTVGLGTLYFNDEQSFSATCPEGQTGGPVTITIPAGTVGSNVSVSDANVKAQAQAQSQAEAQLVCVITPVTYLNDTAQTYTATCEHDGTLEEGAPTPTGDPITYTVPAGTISSTVSFEDANALALAEATAKAINRLSCTYKNAPQTATKVCSDGVTGLVSATVDAGQYSGPTQKSADELAFAAATTQAANLFSGTICPGSPTPATPFGNTEQLLCLWWAWKTQYGGISDSGSFYGGPTLGGGVAHAVAVVVTVLANKYYDTSQYLANQDARNAGLDYARQLALARVFSEIDGTYGTSFNGTYNNFPTDKTAPSNL